MNFEYKHLLPDHFSPTSRVWVYQSNRLFSLSEALEIEAVVNDFCQQWQSHGAEVNAYGNLFFGQFLILMTDETQVAVSGCSTDSSVHFVKQLGDRFKVDFFNRSNLAFIIKHKIQVLPLNQLTYAVDHNFINGETLYFNNTVLNKQQLECNWIIPIKNSWLAKKIKVPA